MESAAYGCATITSKNGGLPETFKDPIFIDHVNEKELFKKIKKLIDFPKLRKKIQLKNFKSVMHKLEYKIKKLDNWKKGNLLKNINIINKNKLKILHISTFDERNDHRLFNISIANKLSKELIRNDHDVINFSYRGFLNKNLITKKINLLIKKQYLFVIIIDQI